MLGWIGINRKSAENLCKLFGCLGDYDKFMHHTSDENLIDERIRYKINAGRNSIALKIERFLKIEKGKAVRSADEEQTRIIKEKRTLSAAKYI